MRSSPWLLLLISQAPFPVVAVVVLVQEQGHCRCWQCPAVASCAQLLLAWPAGTKPMGSKVASWWWWSSCCCSLLTWCAQGWLQATAAAVLALSAEPELLSTVLCCTSSPSVPWPGHRSCPWAVQQEPGTVSTLALLCSVLLSPLDPPPRAVLPNDTHTHACLDPCYFSLCCR